MSIDKLNHQFLCDNRFISIDSEERTVLEQLGKMIGKTNELIDKTKQLESKIELKLDTTDYLEDILENRKLHNNGDFYGSWHGYQSPKELTGVANLEQLKSLLVERINLSALELQGDRFGWRTIHFIGDSISHGANCCDIEMDSWAGIIKRCLAIEYQTPNHGYETIYSPLQNTMGVYTSSHSCDMVGSWVLNEDCRSISFCHMASVEKGAILKVTPNTGAKYCRVLFNAVDNGGTFKVYLANNPTISTIGNTNIGVSGTFYTNPIDLRNANGDLHIMIEKMDSQLTEIVGIQYYDDESQVMLQNYARSGLKLKDVNSSIIPSLCNTSLAFFALGHNDQWDDDIVSFSNKLDEFIYQFKRFNTKVVVLDFIWDESKTTLKNELKRLSNEVNGLYVDLSPYHYQEGFMGDISHPTEKGHQIMASVVAQKLGLGVRSKSSSFIYKKPLNMGLMNGGYLLYENSYREGKRVTFNLGISQVRNTGDVIAIFPKPLQETTFLSGGEEYTILKNGMVVYKGLTKEKHELHGSYHI